MPTSLDPDAVCLTCGQTWHWHRVNNPIHQFSMIEQSRVDADPRTPGTDREGALSLDDAIKRVRAKCDPVIRLLLMQLGIVTAEQIELAEYRVARALSEGKPIVEVLDGATPTAEQDLYTLGRDRPTPSGGGIGGTAIRGLRSDHPRSERSPDQLGQEDDQPSGQPVQQLPFGPEDDLAVNGRPR